MLVLPKTEPIFRMLATRRPCLALAFVGPSWGAPRPSTSDAWNTASSVFAAELAAVSERRALGPAVSRRLSVADTAWSCPPSSSSAGFAAAAARERVPRASASAEGAILEKALLTIPRILFRCSLRAARVSSLPPSALRRRRRRESAESALRRFATPSPYWRAQFVSPDSRHASDSSTLLPAKFVSSEALSNTGHLEVMPTDTHSSAAAPRLSRALTRRSMTWP
mmetsp:Transcript_5617/g.19029  ORF Transcript_5617/g.19029 Transcript_5617/m.19029 type:complete len:224 (+) Transcript_5617:1579-2250(+)